MRPRRRPVIFERDPFWWPMAAPPLPTGQVEPVFHPALGPVYDPVEPLRNPREDLRYLDIAPTIERGDPREFWEGS
jgi:hypothetical protein